VKRSLAVAALSSVIAAMSAAGSPARAGEGSVSLDTRWQRWSWERVEDGPTTDLGQVTGRLTLAYAVNPRLTLEAATGGFGLRWDGFAAEGTEESVSGPLDTRFRATYTVGDRLMFRAGLGAPTGTTEFTAAELPLAQAVTARILEMDGNRLGEGADADVGVAAAVPVGPVAVGLGVGYLFKGGYTVLEEIPEFHPGDQLSIGGGVDVSDSRWRFRVNGRTVTYTEDAFDDVEFQKEGPRTEAQVTLLRRWPATSVWGSVFWIGFENGEVLAGDGLIEEAQKRRGDEVYADLGVRRRFSRALSGSLLGGVRVFSGSDLGLGEATMGVLDAALSWDASSSVGIELSAGYRRGTLSEPEPFLGNLDEAAIAGTAAGLRLVYDF
jgi:hypothetical protein